MGRHSFVFFVFQVPGLCDRGKSDIKHRGWSCQAAVWGTEFIFQLHFLELSHYMEILDFPYYSFNDYHFDSYDLQPSRATPTPGEFKMYVSVP